MLKQFKDFFLESTFDREALDFCGERKLLPAIKSLLESIYDWRGEHFHKWYESVFKPGWAVVDNVLVMEICKDLGDGRRFLVKGMPNERGRPYLSFYILDKPSKKLMPNSR